MSDVADTDEVAVDETATEEPPVTEDVAPEEAVEEDADTEDGGEPAPRAVCPTCGTPAIAGDRFCESCGGDLPMDIAAAATDDHADADDSVGLDDSVRLPASDTPAHLACATCGGTFEDGWCTTCGAKQPAARDHLERELDGLAGVTDRGQHHRRNEDAMALRRDGAVVVAVIGDGVSSTVDPDRASEAAVEAAADLLVSGADPVDAHRAAQEAAAAVEFTPHPDLGAPSTTFLAARVEGQDVTVASLGDCRAFWFSGDVATLLTVDDSWAHEMVASGAMTEAEAMADHRAHVITRWLGQDADDAWEPTVRTFTVSAPGRLLLCSDGLWNYTPEPADVRAAVPDVDVLQDPPIDVARRLVEHANARGGRDNITVAVLAVPS